MKLIVPDKWFTEEELRRTPERWSNIWKDFEKAKNFSLTTFDTSYDDIILLKNINYYSFCSHHLLPFFGQAHIAYIPHKKLCGISKLARVVDMFASRPQIQEEMTSQIADFLVEKLKPKGVMVIVEGTHLCMRLRGVKKENAVMVTSAIRGVFANPPKNKNPREEVLRLLNVDR